MHYCEKVLSQAILAKSESAEWTRARLEWRLFTVWRNDTAQSCLCGHYPIVEVCVIRNRLNQLEAEVGNCCVRRFLGLRSEILFACLRRISCNLERSLNEDAIAYSVERGWLTDWEHRFCLDTMRKRRLSAAQMQCRTRINRKVLAHTRRAAAGVAPSRLASSPVQRLL
jgi:hypothetical protein